MLFRWPSEQIWDNNFPNSKFPSSVIFVKIKLVIDKVMRLCNFKIYENIFEIYKT